MPHRWPPPPPDDGQSSDSHHAQRQTRMFYSRNVGGRGDLRRSAPLRLDRPCDSDESKDDCGRHLPQSKLIAKPIQNRAAVAALSQVAMRAS